MQTPVRPEYTPKHQPCGRWDRPKHPERAHVPPRLETIGHKSVAELRRPRGRHRPAPTRADPQSSTQERSGAPPTKGGEMPTPEKTSSEEAGGARARRRQDLTFERACANLCLALVGRAPLHSAQGPFPAFGRPSSATLRRSPPFVGSAPPRAAQRRVFHAPLLGLLSPPRRAPREASSPNLHFDDPRGLF